jgi:hypothetical protein
MRTTTISALILTLACTAPASAQDWATKMFTTTEHEFGTVARGSKTEFEFKLKNIYLEDVHIADVRSSCGCTRPSIVKPTLKTYEEGAILASINTAAFSGQKGATVTVTIDRPVFAQVQLHVRCYICDDVLLQPESLQFGTVRQGTVAEREIVVSSTGLDFVDVQSANPHLSAKLSRTPSSFGQMVYRVRVALAKAAPAGYLNEHLVLVTNDPSRPQIPVRVQGLVASTISLSPSRLDLGVVSPGEKVVKQVVVRSEKPFRILRVTTADQRFRVDAADNDAPRKVYLIPVTFTAGEKAEQIMQTIHIQTDLEDGSAELPTMAEISHRL